VDVLELERKWSGQPRPDFVTGIFLGLPVNALGVQSRSTLREGGQDITFCPKIYVLKINKMPEFLHDICPKNAQILHDDCLNFFSDFFFLGGGTSPPVSYACTKLTGQPAITPFGATIAGHKHTSWCLRVLNQQFFFSFTADRFVQYCNNTYSATKS